ncbi:MAG TPA: hypothetical protein VGK24_03510 [Candidatus Angelobacter sp.]|jgi:hypothetical protein
MLASLLNNDWFKSTAALVIGWLLSAINPYLSERRERRKAIARALAELMEIRHRLGIVEYAMDTIGKVVNIPPEAEMQVRIIFQTLFAKLQQVGQQYAESVTLVKSIDPVLGFKLQSKDELQPMLNNVFALIAQANDPQAAAVWKSINLVILKEAETDLSELIKKLAMKRSIWTRWRVNKMLSQNRPLPKGADAILEILRAEAAKQAPAPQEPTKAAASGSAQ